MRDMTGQRRRIRHDDVTAERAVVADVRVRHQKIVIADSRMSAASLRSAMDVHVFAKDVVMADRQERLFAFKLQILRR